MLGIVVGDGSEYIIIIFLAIIYSLVYNCFYDFYGSQKTNLTIYKKKLQLE